MDKPFSAYQGDEPYVFVCYAHADRAEVYPELIRLGQAGVNLWYDEGISPGSEWTEELAAAINGCARFLYFISPAAVESKYCRDEVQFARNAEKPIVSVYVHPTELPDGLRLEIGRFQAVVKYNLSDDDYRRKLHGAIAGSSVASEVASLAGTPLAARHAPTQRVRFWGLGALITLAVAVAWLLLWPAPPIPPVSSYKQLTRSQVQFPPAPSPYPLVTDGTRIYFNDWNPRRGPGLRQVSLTGGEAIRIDPPFAGLEAPVVQTLTPNGAQLLIARAGRKWSLWSMATIGGEPRLLGDGRNATFSPDGSKLLYTDDWAEIFIANPDLSEPRSLIIATGRVYWPRFSPDGQRIRFSVVDSLGLHQSTMEVAVDGTGLHPVLPGWKARRPCCGSWTPDGRYYIFQATRDSRSQLWALREQGGAPSEPIQITHGALDFRRPTIAADGKSIFAIGWQLRGELVRFDPKAERFVAPLPGFESLSAEWLVFSKDESRIAYVSYPDGDLWRSNRDGTGRVQLTFAPMRVTEPVWSPDGKTIAFRGLMPDKPMRIYLAAADGGPVRPATPGSTQQWAQMSPTWSPDGRSLAFTQVGTDDNARPQFESPIQLLDLSTTTVSTLDGSEGLFFPRWSPAGDQLIATGKEGLQLFDIRTQQREKLIEGLGGPFTNYQWSQDGQHVYIHDGFQVPDARILQVDLRDKSQKVIASLGDTRGAWGTWSIWIGITPGGEPMLLRDLGIHHIYALEWDPDG